MKVLRVSLFCIVLFLVAISSFSQERLISSGLLLSGGAGTLDYEFVSFSFTAESLVVLGLGCSVGNEKHTEGEIIGFQ